ncbi:MAG: PilZ domain-containing protein [Methylococcales bacterium]|nr:PilZ domain-containing protein [Methylococcales bacterium]
MTDSSKHELRQFHRILHQANAHLSQGEQHWPCQVRDLSLHGCLLHFPQSQPELTEQPFQLDIPLSDTEHVTMTVSIAHHAEANTLGFRCDHLDLDSITHLRRLIELNLGDSHLLDRDLQILSTLLVP